MKKELFGAIWVLIGIMLGAGVFGLPYVFYEAGFYTGLIVTAAAMIIMAIITLYLGEISLRTKGKHQLTGLAQKYLGNKGKIIMFTANLLSIYGALAAYITGGGQALVAIFGGSNTLFYILFFIFVAPVVYFSINIMRNFESIFTPTKIIVVVILSFLLLKFADFSNVSGFNIYNILLPYGVAIFAFSGFSAVPEMNEMLKNKKYMFSAIILGMIITFSIIVLFVLSVIVSADKINEVATVSLSNLGFGVNLFSNLFAFFAMSTAFVALGFALKENFTLDFKLPNSPSWFLVVFFPIALVLSGFFGFVKLVELTGALAVGIILILILIMHTKAKSMGNRNPEYSISNNFLIKFILFIILSVGIIYTILSFF